MDKTEFPTRPRRDDTHGHMTVWQMVEFLRDQYDKFRNSVGSGTSTVTNGNTVLIVNHGLSAASYHVSLTPLADPGGRFWVTNKTATSFQINLQVAAPVAGVPFDWIVKGV